MQIAYGTEIGRGFVWYRDGENLLNAQDEFNGV